MGLNNNVLHTIRQQMPQFSKGQKRIAAYILEHYDKAAFMTASRLGQTVEVSESTVVRFAAQLGYEGYPEMQRDLRELIRGKLTSIQRIQVSNDQMQGDLLTSVMQRDMDSLRTAIEQVDRGQFEQMVDKLLKAQHIYLLGMRSSSFLTGYLNFYFRLIFKNVTLVQNAVAGETFEQLVQVQLNQEKVDAINEKLMELIDTQLEVAHTQLEEAEAKIKAGRAEYDKQFKNFGNTVSNTVMGTLSSEVGEAVEVVRKQAEALLQSVNNLIAVVKEPEVQQALIEVQAGLQRVMDKFNNTGMRDIDSLIEIVSELRDITDKLSSALQTLQNRINTETGTQGEGAADLADELQLQDSLNVIYKTLEDTIKAMDNVPGMMSEFSKALGNFTQQQMVAYMQFTEAREQLNEYEKQLSEAKTQYEAAKEKALASADVTKQLDIKTCHPHLRPELLHARRLRQGRKRRVVAAEGGRGIRQRGGYPGRTAAPCGGLRRRAPFRCGRRGDHRQRRRQLHPPERRAGFGAENLQGRQFQRR